MTFGLIYLPQHNDNRLRVKKKKEIRKYVITLMKLEDVVLSEKASHRRTNSARFHFYEISKIVKSLKADSKMVSRIWAKREMATC